MGMKQSVIPTTSIRPPVPAVSRVMPPNYTVNKIPYTTGSNVVPVQPQSQLGNVQYGKGTLTVPKSNVVPYNMSSIPVTQQVPVTVPYKTSAIPVTQQVPVTVPYKTSSIPVTQQAPVTVPYNMSSIPVTQQVPVTGPYNTSSIPVTQQVTIPQQPIAQPLTIPQTVSPNVSQPIMNQRLGAPYSGTNMNKPIRYNATSYRPGRNRARNNDRMNITSAAGNQYSNRTYNARNL